MRRPSKPFTNKTEKTFKEHRGEHILDLSEFGFGEMLLHVRNSEVALLTPTEKCLPRCTSCGQADEISIDGDFNYLDWLTVNHKGVLIIKCHRCNIEHACKIEKSRECSTHWFNRYSFSVLDSIEDSLAVDRALTITEEKDVEND